MILGRDINSTSDYINNYLKLLIHKICLHLLDRIRRFLRELHPRAMTWRYFKTLYPKRPILARLPNRLRLRVHPYDVIGKTIFVNGVFEKAETLFVTSFLRQGMVFFDIGANLGYYTLLGAECVGSTGRVHSFEPSARMFSELQFNVSLNRLSENCTLNQVAVSEKEGIAQFPQHKLGKEIYGSLAFQKYFQSTIIGYHEVKTIALDNYLAKHVIPAVDLIKIDIEGAELLALRGARRLLSRDNAPAIVLEIADILTQSFGYKGVEICKFLSAYGYEMFELAASGKIARSFQIRSEGDFACSLIALKMGNRHQGKLFESKQETSNADKE